MLLSVDPATFYVNLILILGAVVLLTLLFGAVVVTVTLIRTGLWVRRRRAAEQLWRKVSHRADGRAYPPSTPGICEQCRRGGRYIYADYGRMLCPACYEKHWREVERWEGAVDGAGLPIKGAGGSVER